MNNKEQFKRMIMFFSGFIIALAVSAVFSVIWTSYYNYSEELKQNIFWRNGNVLLVLLYMLLYVVFGRSFGGFRVGSLKTVGLIGSQILTVLFTNFFAYIFISLISRGFLRLGPTVLMTIIDFICIIFWVFASKAIYARIYPPKKMIIVFGSTSARDLVQKMSVRVDKYLICSSISIEEPLEKINKKILGYDGVILCDIPSQIRNKILKFAYENSIRTYINPKISDIIIRGADEIHLFDTPLILSKNIGLGFEEKIIKRFVDILLSLIAVIISSPFMLIIAFCIKLYDRGPVFYKQTRLTQGGRKFNVVKFRSMIVNAEEDGVARLAADKDKRITPVGKFIRKTRLDELPQLLNILVGDMSFVGPRPERPEIADQYLEDMPEFKFRLKVKAGLTGYAQVMGKYNTTPYDKLKLDLIYIQNYSLLLDLKIMLQTLKIIFVPESTEGVESGKTTAKKVNRKIETK